MSNKFKTAYIKYIENFSKYTELSFEKRDSIIVRTTDDHFPHLIGFGHFPKYAKLPSRKIIDDIRNDVIDNRTLFSNPSKILRSIVLNKFEVFNNLNSLVGGYLIEKENCKINLGENNVCDALLYKKISKKEYAVIALKKDPIKIYHPTSVLLLGENQRKMLKLLSEKK